MEKEGIVSLWVGHVDSAESLEQLLQISYSEDGDFLPSAFAAYFEIQRYDDAVREAEYYEVPSNNLETLLEGFSYDEEIIPRFAALVDSGLPNEFNAVILFYNFEYTGEIKEARIRSNYAKFLGAVEYK